MQVSPSQEERSNDLLLQARRKPRVEGVCFDRFSRRWVAKRAGGKKVYFPVYKYGFHHAYELAVHTRKKSEGDLVAVAAVSLTAAGQTGRSHSSDAQSETPAAGKNRRDHVVVRCLAAARRSKPFSSAAAEGRRRSSAHLAGVKQEYASRRYALGPPRPKLSVTEAGSTTAPRVLRDIASLTETSDTECRQRSTLDSPRTDVRRDAAPSIPSRTPREAVAPGPARSTPDVSAAGARGALQVETALRDGRLLEEQTSHATRGPADSQQHMPCSPEGGYHSGVSGEACCWSGCSANHRQCPSTATIHDTHDSREPLPAPDANASCGRTWQESCCGDICGCSWRVCHSVQSVTLRKHPAPWGAATCPLSFNGQDDGGAAESGMCGREGRDRACGAGNLESGRLLEELAPPRNIRGTDQADSLPTSADPHTRLADGNRAEPTEGHETSATNGPPERCPVNSERTDVFTEWPEQLNGEIMPGGQARLRPTLRRSSRLLSGPGGWRDPQRRVCQFATAARHRGNTTEERSCRSLCHFEGLPNGTTRDSGLQQAPAHPVFEKATISPAAVGTRDRGYFSSEDHVSSGEGRFSPTVELLVQCLLLIMDDLATLCIPGIFGRFSEDGWRRLQAIQQHRAILANPDNFRSVLPAYFRVCWPLLKGNVLPHETELEKVRKLLGGLHQVALSCKLLFPAYPLQGELDNREGPYAVGSRTKEDAA